MTKKATKMSHPLNFVEVFVANGIRLSLLMPPVVSSTTQTGSFIMVRIVIGTVQVRRYRNGLPHFLVVNGDSNCTVIVNPVGHLAVKQPAVVSSGVYGMADSSVVAVSVDGAMLKAVH